MRQRWALHVIIGQLCISVDLGCLRCAGLPSLSGILVIKVVLITASPFYSLGRIGGVWGVSCKW